MKQTLLLRVIIGWAVFVVNSLLIFGQAPDQVEQTPQLAAQTQTPPAKRRHIPLFGNADEFSLGADFGYYAPQPGFDRQNRDIDVQLADITLSAHMTQGWEFLADGFVLRAHGTSTESSSPGNPQVKSNALALGGGPGVRWNFLQFRVARLFLDAGGALLLADRPFPRQGSAYDFLLRAGGGVSIRISDLFWAEAAFHFGHISNGQGFGSGNPTWQGNGVSLGIRRVFQHPPKGQRRSCVPILRKADEGAWTTTAEYYTPSLGSNRSSNLQGDLRVLRISRAWHFPNRLELQLAGSVQKTESATGFGPLLRWNFLEHERWRVFADGGADFVQTGSPAFIIPWTGDGYHFFLRGGGGVILRLHPSYWLESSFRWVHVTSGFGSGADGYPMWTGQGLSLGFRHTF